jgi:hypothetical protein
MTASTIITSLPFGEYKGVPLGEVPTSYLKWVASIRTTSFVREGVVAELLRRGERVPQPRPPRPVQPCERCPGAPVNFRWTTDALHRRHVKATCGRCDKFLTFAPAEPPYSDLADAAEGRG